MSAPGRRRLSPAVLAALPAAVHRPAFDRGALATGIVHLGIGAFARAHLLPMTDAAIAATGDMRWGVAGVSLRSADTRDALAPQQGLYTLALRDADAAGAARQRLQVVGSLRSLHVAAEDPAAVLRLIAAPQTRVVSLTVTEKGYCHDPATGQLLPGHPDIVHDLEGGPPRSAPGFLVRGLQQRRQAGLGGLTLLSLDNLPSNGDTLASVVHTLAHLVDPALAGWIAAHCSTPNSMVDRIVPRTTEADRQAVADALGVDDAWPVVGEPYAEWAVEDRFVAGRPAWDAGGARFVAAAAPFERLKLRMVNGCHSTLAYLGGLAGVATVDAAVREPALRGLLESMMRREIEPTLGEVPAVELATYRARLLGRFENPALQHRLAQIAIDGSQKLPQRLLGTVRDALAAGRRIDGLALAIAGWQRWLLGRDETGAAVVVDDPLAAELQRLLRQDGTVLGCRAVFGDLGSDQRFVQAVAQATADLDRLGALAAAARRAD